MAAGAQELRLFVAVPLPDPIRELVARCRESVEVREGRLRFVDPAGIHLTLTFLGSVPTNLVASVTESIARASSSSPAFSVEVGGLGGFACDRGAGGRRGGDRRASGSVGPGESSRWLRVLWLGVGTAEPLVRLAARVVEALLPLGLDLDRRPLTPHVTVARASGRGRACALVVLPEREPGSIPVAVEEIVLHRSELESGVPPRYTALHRFPLAAPDSPRAGA